MGVRLSVYKGAMLASGAITATPTFPATSLAVSYSVGAYTDAYRGMRVNLYTSGGALKGVTHVRYSGTLSAAALPIREVSDAKISIISGDTFELIDEPMLVPKLPIADETFSPDGIAYSDEGSNPPPVACSGGHWAGRISRTAAFATVGMYGGSSSLVDPDSASAVAHAWTLPTGIAYASGSGGTDASPTLEVDPGMRVVKHVVTDPDNGKTSTQRIILIADNHAGDYSYPVLSATVEEAEQGLSAAYGSATVEVPSPMSVDDAPDGALAILWADEETIGGAANIYRNWLNVRSGILFVGYIRRDASVDDPDSGDMLTLELISPMARLAEMVSYTKAMTEVVSPAKWSELISLGVKRALTQVIQFYTSLIEAGFDWRQVNSTYDKDYPDFRLQKTSFYGQVVELASAIRMRVCCDATGGFWTDFHPALRPLADRAGTQTTSSYTDADVYPGYGFSRQQWEPVEQCRVRGFTKGGSPQPVVTVYPGVAPGAGTDNIAYERQIVDDMADAKDAAGMFGAYHDGVCVDSAGARHYASTLDITFPGAYDHFGFYRLEYMQFILDNARDVDTTDALYYLKRRRTTYADGTAEVSAQFGEATYAPAGEQDALETTVNPPNDDPPVTVIDPPSFPGTPNSTVNNMALLTLNGIAWTSNFQSSSPAWNYASWVSLSVSGTFQCWVPNGFAAGSGWVVTSTGVYYGSLATRAFTLKKAFSAAFDVVGADASFGTENHFVCVGYRETGTTGCSAYYTTDNSTFSSEINITSYYNNLGYFGKPSVYVSPKTPGLVYVGAFTATGGENSTAALYRSTDYGATWGASAALTAPSDNVILYPSFKIPFAHGDELTAFYGTSQGFSSHLLYRSIGTGQVDITPTISSYGYTPFDTVRGGIDISVINKNRLVMVGYRTGTATYAAFLTNDAFATTPTWTVIAADGTNARYCALAGDTISVGWLWGASNYIKQMSISGTTVTLADKAGNLSDYSAGQIVAIGGY